MTNLCETSFVSVGGLFCLNFNLCKVNFILILLKFFFRNVLLLSLIDFLGFGHTRCIFVRSRNTLAFILKIAPSVTITLKINWTATRSLNIEVLIMIVIWPFRLGYFHFCVGHFCLSLTFIFRFCYYLLHGTCGSTWGVWRPWRSYRISSNTRSVWRPWRS